MDSLIFSSMKRSYAAYHRCSVVHNKHSSLLSADRFPVQSASNRCFMKKMGLKPGYDVYNKKAAKDKVSPTEYELVYIGNGEKYVRMLSGVLIAAIIFVPSLFIIGYVYLFFTEESIDLKTYYNVMLIPHTSFELMILLTTLFCLKIASYSFISKFVLRIYKHNTKTQYVGVFINPVLPWKNITCTFDRAIKLPDGKNVLIPWHKEYYKLAGYKSIVLKERFRRPIDYDRMLGKMKTMDE